MTVLVPHPGRLAEHAAELRARDGWTQPTLESLNAEFRERALWRKTPEGKAYTAKCDADYAEERMRQEQRLIGDLVARIAP